ncbi:MAG: tRNA (adenosine(37)-N6)-threonylcarbamoyltransferase complex dimerization subunit type 1 TsaB [Microbacteriaceae bacterium]|nr:tRNA (adenosine(37)-N6)-threonylcarbamoyltransferase complex dimerization subunit type 1 TsaB [Microbacteriaceae bacterium]
MLLAIDTSAGTSVAMVDGDRTLAEAASADPRGHAEAIGVLIERVLRESGAVPDAVVAGMGPGPFTGLRVGIAAARAFAYARGIPVHGVCSHDGIAEGRTAPTLVVTDARRREVAWSVYRDGERVDGPHLASPEELPSVVEGYTALDRVDAVEVSAASLALVAARLLAAGRPTGPDQPLYLRAPDVTVPAGPKRVTG